MSFALSSPAALRNRDPILDVLRRWLPDTGLVVEIAAGSGEHAVWFSRGLPGLTWRPTDPDAEARASIETRRATEGGPNLLAPLALDAADPASWPVEQADAVVCINMIHISPWRATQGLMEGAARILPAGGVLVLYGPYLDPEVETAPSNLAFDASLKSRNPAWGLRELDAVKAEAAKHGLLFRERVAMPANNLCLAFEKAGGADLERLMAEAVRDEDFETAARLRDRLQALGSRLTPQIPGKMGLGTSGEVYNRPPGWKPPPKPDLMTGRRKPPRGPRK